uniref:Uncharacterized protein n=1 Tax=Romanomermis culicivorax TaxID=13658 RepID=A0A915KI45_ROMCU
MLLGVLKERIKARTLVADCPTPDSFQNSSPKTSPLPGRESIAIDAPSFWERAIAKQADRST